jgi:hypothetical protein
MVSLDGGFLESAVHAFDLAVRPWIIDPGCPVCDVMLAAAQVEQVRDVSDCRAVAVTGAGDRTGRCYRMVCIL